MNIAALYLEDALSEFTKTRRLAEKAMAQVSDEEFFRVLSPEANSIAILVKHMSGNMRSRWTDFLTTDGEKPDRNRDTEFVIDAAADTRASLMQRWNTGWELVHAALAPIAPGDLGGTITIRGEPHTIVKAINRQLTHYAYHAGQIVFLARHFHPEDWTTLSVARGQSGAFNAEMARKAGKPF